MRSNSLTLDPTLQRSTFEGLEIWSRPAAGAPLLFFHGFPGPFAPLPEGELRIVDQLYDLLTARHAFYYPLYTCKQGPFSFAESLQDGDRALAFVGRTSDRAPVLMGQSWGAVIALQLARRARFEKIILMVPFLFLPSGAASRAMMLRFSGELPGLIPADAVDHHVTQIETLREHHSPTEALRAVSCPVTLIATVDDELVPIAKLRELAASLPHVKLIELPGTHEVEDREALHSLVAQELKP